MGFRSRCKLDPDFTVLENLLVYARYFRIPKAEARRRALELLELFQLTEKKDAIVEHISGGMKKRLILARALINEPTIGDQSHATALDSMIAIC